MGRMGSSDQPDVAVRFGEERETMILQKLAGSHALGVSELASMLHVAEATVRRDLARLANAGLIRRTHGGAMLLSADTDEEEAMIRREMLTCSHEGILMADHGKFGDRKPFTICRWDCIHVLVTDCAPMVGDADVLQLSSVRIVTGPFS